MKMPRNTPRLGIVDILGFWKLNRSTTMELLFLEGLWFLRESCYLKAVLLGITLAIGLVCPGNFPQLRNLLFLVPLLFCPQFSPGIFPWSTGVRFSLGYHGILGPALLLYPVS